MNSVKFISRHDAEKLRPAPRSVLISVYDRCERELIPRPGWQDVLYLRFHDSDGSHMGLEQFSLEQAQAALEFVGKHAECAQLVVHCQMGRSRSAALALFFAEVFGVPCYKNKSLVSLQDYKFHNRRVLELLRFAHKFSATSVLDGGGSGGLPV